MMSRGRDANGRVAEIRPNASLAVVPLCAAAASVAFALVGSLADPAMGLAGRAGVFAAFGALAGLMAYVWRRLLVRVGMDTIELRWSERGKATVPRSALRSIEPRRSHEGALQAFVFVARDGAVLAELPTGDIGWRGGGPWTEDQMAHVASILAIEYQATV